MNKGFGLLAGGMLLGAVTAFGTQSAFLSDVNAADDGSTYQYLALFGDAFERIRANYVEEPNEKEMIYAAIDGMLQSLDPHSSFLTPEDFLKTRTEVEGEFGGLGIRFQMEDGLVKVITALEGTPAEKEGLLGGDYVTHINGESIKGWSTTKAVEEMRGEVGASIKLTIYRPETNKTFDVVIVRALIKDIPTRRELYEDVGYVRMSQFNENSTSGLEDAIRKLDEDAKAEGIEIKGFILDLRNNPGGVLKQAVDVSDAFLERGEVLTTRGRNPQDVRRYAATKGDIIGGRPLIVMINGGSASASEIVAGALQDLERAVILGSRSFGKASVQSLITMGNQGALRLTTARYYTPSGRSIQAKGIDPDIFVRQPLPDDRTEAEVNPGGEASIPGHLATEGENQEEYKGSSAYVPRDKEDDKQLLMAIDLIKGKEQNDFFDKLFASKSAKAE